MQNIFASPNSLTFQAKIVKPNQDNLEEPSVYFKFKYTDALGTCVVYEEEFSSVVMTGSKGLVSLELGTGVKTYPPAAVTLYDVFNFGSALSCQGGTPTANVTPAAVERRKVIVQFNDGSGMQTLPVMNLNSVPFALHATMANNSNQLAGLSANQYTKFSDITAAGCVAGQALRYTGANFVCETISGTGVSTVTATAPVLSTGGANPVISVPKATAAVSGYLASADWTIFNNKLSNFSTMTSVDITTALTYTPLNRASNLLDLANVTTARTNLGLGTAAVLNVAAAGDAAATEVVKGNDTRLTGAFQSGTALSGDVTGTVAATVVASVGGVTAANVATGANLANNSTNVNTASAIVRRNASGDFTAGVINATTFSGTNASATNVSTQNVYLFDAGNINRILFKAPASGITNYTLTLPAAVGTNGQVLATNASGDLSWANPSSGSVTSVTASAPLASSGGVTPNITLTRSSATVDGYLASSDFSIFNNKLSNFSTMTSVDVTTALTFIPLNRASNLSDLANATTARTNLGLGTAAVLNEASSGDATAAELVKGNDTRLTNARAPSGAASGDLTGTYPNPTLIITGVVASTDYTKVTVDAKGRVTSAGRLVSSDITTLYGYTPANDNAAWSLNVSGDVSRTTGNVGIGTNAPLTRLQVAGTLKVADGAEACSIAGDGGMIRYSGSALQFCNGSSWQTLGISGAGLTSLNSLTGSTQTFATGTAGTDFGINSATTVHTFNLPTASATNRGALSSADWSIFNSKQNALGYTPLNPANNLSDVASADVSRTNLGLGNSATRNVGTAAATVAAGDDSRITGAFQAATALSGDVTGSVAATVVSNVGGVTAANVATGANLANNSTNANTASTIVRRNASGDFTAGVINATTFSGTNASTTNVSTQNIYLFDSVNTNRILFKAPASGITNYTLTLPAAVGSNGQVLSTNASGDLSWANASSGSVTSVTATAPLVSSGGASPDISLARSTASVDGYLASSDFSIFNNKLGVATVFSGDVTGTYNATVLANVGTAGTYAGPVTVDTKGRVTAGVASLDLTSGVSGILPIARGGTNASAFTTWGVNFFDGTSITSSPAGLSNQLLVQSATGPIWTTATYPSATTANQLLYSSANNTVTGLATTANSVLTTNASGDPSWSLLSGDIYTQYAMLAGRAGGQSLNGGTLASQDLTLDSTSHATKGNIVLNPTGGNVGIGTATPAQKLEVAGSVNIGSQITRTTASTDRGQLASGSTFIKTSAGSTTLDASDGNIQEVASFVCNGANTITFSNMRDGGVYTVLLSGVAAHSGVCLFAHAGLTFKTSGANTAPTTAKDVLFTFAVIGTNVIYTMMDNLQ